MALLHVSAPQHTHTQNECQLQLPLIIVALITSALTITLHFINCTECCALLVSIPVAVRCNAWVCSRSIPGLAGSNPVQDMDFRLLRLLCRVGRSLCDELIALLEESYGGVCA
jgi:hypothetical protein